MNSLFLDICAEDYEDGEVKHLRDRYGNYSPYFVSNQFTSYAPLLKNGKGLYVIGDIKLDNSSNYQSAIFIEDALKIPQVYSSSNLWICAVITLPTSNLLSEDYNSSSYLIHPIQNENIWSSATDPSIYPFLQSFNGVINRIGQKMYIVGSGEVQDYTPSGLAKALPYILGGTYIIAMSISQIKNNIFEQYTKIFSIYGNRNFYRRYQSNITYGVNNTPGNVNAQSFPKQLLFFSAAQFSGFQFRGYIKRCGVYPYSKIQEFKKQYLGK